MEQLRLDYVRTAAAKGVSHAAVVWRHALRNALIPVVTVVSLDIGTLFSGALITETMFSYLGMGKLIYDSIIGNDYNVALIGPAVRHPDDAGAVEQSSLADRLSTPALDPRIGFERRRMMTRNRAGGRVDPARSLDPLSPGRLRWRRFDHRIGSPWSAAYF